jgi:hypothetical protein
MKLDIVFFFENTISMKKNNKIMRTGQYSLKIAQYIQRVRRALLYT